MMKVVSTVTMIPLPPPSMQNVLLCCTIDVLHDSMVLQFQDFTHSK